MVTQNDIRKIMHQRVHQLPAELLKEIFYVLGFRILEYEDKSSQTAIYIRFEIHYTRFVIVRVE